MSRPRTHLTFAEAQAIGGELHARFEAMTGREAPFEAEDMAWPDIVQFVVRRRADYLERKAGSP